MKITQIIGHNIKRLREQQGIKQETLARQLGVTKGRMSQIESGKCEELSISRLEKIAGLLQVDFFELTKTIDAKAANCYDNTNYYGLDYNNLNVSPDLIKRLADELINRMSK